MVRALLLLILIAIAAVWVDPHWNAEARTLRLRVREPEEILRAVRAGARTLGEEVARVASEEPERVAEEPAATPPVGAGRLPTPAPAEELTPEDRASLDELIEEKLRED